MDEAEIAKLYTEDDMTLREVGRAVGLSHHAVRRSLQRSGIEVVRKKRPRAFTAEHRRKISESCKGRTAWSLGLKMDERSRRKNMQAKLGDGVEVDKYPDFERLKLLTKLTSKHRTHLGSSGGVRSAFLDRFYFDAAFNAIYERWIASSKCRWWMPSLDHIVPLSKGGGFGLDNLRFVTWFENRAKADMSLVEWHDFRRRTRTTSALFIEEILAE